MGDTWVHLPMCLECAHVGCCDSSKNKHATKHFNWTKHPLVRSIEPGEWRGAQQPMTSRCDGAILSSNTSTTSLQSSIANISVRSTSANQGACCLRLRLILPDLRPMRRWSASEHH